MNLPRKSGALVLGVVTVGIGTLLVWGLLQDPAEPWQRLGNGATVRVVGVTYGTEHRVTEGQIWQRLLQPLLPEGLPLRVNSLAGWDAPFPRNRGAFPGIPSSVPGYFGGWRDQWDLPFPELLVWVRHRNAASQWSAPNFDLLDEHGCRFAGVNQWFMSSPRSEELIAVRFAAFPRRTNLVRLVPRNPEHLSPGVSGLTARAPDLGPSPTWTPRQVPQTQSAGELAFSFVGWKGGRANPMGQFAVSQRGAPTRDWEPVTLTVLDATGNSVTTTRDLEVQPDPTRIIFRGLCRYEPAWKLHVEFAPTFRTKPGESPAPQPAPTWRWTPTIPAPRQQRRFISGVCFSQPGLGLEVVSAAPLGVAHDSPRDRSPLCCSTVSVRMKGAKEPVRVTLARVTDENGRSAVPRWQSKPLEMQWDPFRPRPSHLFRPGDEARTFVLPELPGAKTLKLEFVTHRAVSVDFLVAPPAPGSTALR